MHTRLIFLIYTLILPAFALAADLCDQPSVKTIEAQVDPSRPKLGTFSYKYQYIQSAHEKDPVVIVIPGGPGGTSISPYDENAQFNFVGLSWGLPLKFNAIFTDPRTVGCNLPAQRRVPLAAVNSFTIAHDILTVIKALKLTNYVLMGHSYGTVVATILAAQLQELSLPQPSRIILSGTLGRAMKADEQGRAMERAWAHIQKQLPPYAQKLLHSNLETMEQKTIAGVPGSAWLAFIDNGLTEGAGYVGGKKMYSIVEQLSFQSADDPKLKNLISQLKELSLQSSGGGGRSPIFMKIMCTELLVEHEECRRLGYYPTNTYNSRHYDIAAPIVYIHGQYDPAVTIESGNFHFLNQRGGKNLFLTIPDGGHSNLASINDCSDAFWSTLQSHASEFARAMKTCLAGLNIQAR